MKPGDLVKWTFAKTSTSFNKTNISYFGILLHPVELPHDSWMILLADGKVVHGDHTEIEVIKASEDR
tara:strand:- start:78 stop:278 length:201 start_codon:yes stop_codon:yes gene_type:complete